MALIVQVEAAEINVRISMFNDSVISRKFATNPKLLITSMTLRGSDLQRDQSIERGDHAMAANQLICQAKIRVG